MSPWTDEITLRLKALFLTGNSGSETAEALNREFKTTFTRNAVIGRAHRLGITGTHKVMNREPKAPKPPKDRLVVVKRNVAPIAPIEPPPVCEPVGFMDLEPHHCRWTMGKGPDGLATFCGARHKLGSSFCGFHHRIAWHPAPKPQKVKAPLPVERERTWSRFA